MIVAIANQKGGVGKSTTAQAVGSILHSKGDKVLFVDLDPQGNLTYSLKGQNTGKSIAEVLQEKNTALEAIQSTEGGDLIAHSPTLSGADLTLTQTGKEYRLREALEPIKGLYNWIIIDTPPSLGILTVNALTAATRAIITAQADIYSLQGIGQLHSTITAVKQYTNTELVVAGILLTRYNRRTILSRDITSTMRSIAAQIETKLFTTKIRENIAIKEAQARQQSICTYAPKSNGCVDYRAFTKELIKELTK